ncbi:nuclear receptor subfamily 1 group I member 3 isoform X4 [Fukomys damarensis]|uniref:nuclear receptor subfamily 1 group I member 3 isoform X4 n=1 Tax=Fukomys damarensis TaxID=885580 RepID=UPI00054027AF|nr:nuclear receptor subfamily 1 group I member 3 isoform X4 [Fukomys damarensis]
MLLVFQPLRAMASNFMPLQRPWKAWRTWENYPTADAVACMLCVAEEEQLTANTSRIQGTVMATPTPESTSSGEVILSAEALALRRAKQDQRRAKQAALQLSKKQKEIVQTLLEAHTRHLGTMFDQFVQFRPPAHLFIHHQHSTATAPVLPLLTHFADINTFILEQVIKFTKELPLFRSLPMEDQIFLLKGAAIEMGQIALNTTFCLQTQNFFCGPLRYTLEDGAHVSPTVGFQRDFLELFFRFHGTLRQLQLQEPEYVLMAAMALFSPDRPGVTQKEEIDQLQEEMALTLDRYIRGQQPRPRNQFRYAKLLGLLVELRSIHSTYWHQIQHIHGFLAMMPLLQEICS